MLNRDLERLRSGQKPYEPEYAKCFSCGCHWFEVITASRIDTNVVSDLGQMPAEVDKFHLLRCLKCGDMQEPPLANNMMSPLRKSYDDLLDALEEKKEEESDKKE